MIDLNAILGNLTGTAQLRQEAIAGQVQQMNADTAAMQNLMTVNQEEAAQVAQAGVDIAGKTAAVEYTRNKTLENAQNILGLNPDDLNNQLVQSMAAYNTAETDRQQTRKQFDQLSQISLLDNPLGWIAAQLQLPQVAAQNNALVDARDAAAENLATRQRLLTAQKSAVVANTAEAIKDIRTAEAENALAAARIKLREAEIENSSKIAGRKLQAFQLSDKMFDIESDLVGKQLQVGQYMMSLEERREARAERTARYQEEQKKKQITADKIAAYDVNLARVSKFIGTAIPMNAELVDRMPDGKKKQAWMEAAINGSIGEDLISSVAFINANGNPAALRTNNPGVAIAAQGFGAGIESYAADVERKARAEGKTLKPKDIVDGANDAYTNDVIASASRPGTGNSLTSKRWDSVFNPYKADHRVMLDEIAAGKLPLQNNALVANLKLAQGDKITSDDELNALKALALQVKSGKLNIDTASQQVSEYYRVAAAKNMDLYQYTLFNMPVQTSYRGQIPGMGWFGAPVDVDLMNPISVRKGLLQIMRGGTKEQTIVPGTMRGAYEFGVELSGPVGDVVRNKNLTK